MTDPFTVILMSRYYNKNSYTKLNRTQHIGAQPAEREISRETEQRPENQSVREQKGRKCHECGIVLKDKRLYVIDWIDGNLQTLCIECYAEQPG